MGRGPKIGRGNTDKFFDFKPGIFVIMETSGLGGNL